MNDALRCPRCNSTNVETLKTARPQSYRCVDCEYVWDQPFAQRTPDRRAAKGGGVTAADTRARKG